MYSKELWEKKTVIKDMVHGYIAIPKPIVKEIVDTESFQRLKDIEQTGMEALYPSATHKRFTHSLGVFHLADEAFNYFSNNVKNDNPVVYKAIANNFFINAEGAWNRWHLLFTLAALLHDCGHSPFSHTLEFIYDIAEVPKDETLDARIKQGMPISFAEDMLNNNGKHFGKPHERMSALLIKSSMEGAFRNAINKLLYSHATAYEYFDCTKQEGIGWQLADEIEFMMRMIVGCRYNCMKEYTNFKHNDKWAIELQLRNCIIGMLNSQLDVDNLDYVVRDSKFSGYASYIVDLERLLSSFTIVTAVDVQNYKVNPENRFDYCVNLKEFKGDFVNARISGSCHMNCDNSSISTIGRVALKEREECQQAKKRVFMTLDEFSAQVLYKSIDKENFVTIIPPKDSEQDYAYLHIRGSLCGLFTGTIFINEDTIPDYWKGQQRIEFAYEQKCMSVLMSAIYNSNFEKKWIYSHHITTFTNNFLYIYLLERYAEYPLMRNKDSFIEDTLSQIEGISYLESKTTDTSKCSVLRKEIEDGLKSWSSNGLVQPPLLKSMKSLDSIETLESVRILIELYKIYEISPWDNDQQTKVNEVKDRISESLFNCVHNNKHITLNGELVSLYEKYNGIQTGEMQVISDILSMYKTYSVDSIRFERVSDRDLLSAYQQLYLQCKTGVYGNKFMEFQESYEELTSRKFLSCMWKSAPEFEYYFSDWTKDEIIKLMNILHSTNRPDNFDYCVFSDNIKEFNEFQKEFWDYLKDNYAICRAVYVRQTIHTKKFIDYTMYMRRKKKVLRLKDVKFFNDDLQELDFFYFYYKQNDNRTIDVFEILDWLKKKI